MARLVAEVLVADHKGVSVVPVNVEVVLGKHVAQQQLFARITDQRQRVLTTIPCTRIEPAHIPDHLGMPLYEAAHFLYCCVDPVLLNQMYFSRTL